MRRIIALLALVGAALPAVAQECPSDRNCCGAAQRPGAGTTTAPADAPPAPRDNDPDALIEIASDSASVTRAGDASVRGQVVLRQGDRRITAESASYDSDTGDFAVEGDVVFSEPDLTVRGSSGSWRSAVGARIGGAKFELPRRPARGEASEIRVAPDGDLTLTKVRFTTCPVGRDDWMLKAARITIDQQAQQGTGRNVRLDFQGVPILYTPYISFPVGDARKSGFLFPNFGRSAKYGFDFSVPYYFNLAPNYDLTVTPRLMTQRGLQVGAEFRYLTRTSRGTLTGDYLPSDNVADRDRSYARLVNVTDFTDSLRLSVDAANASDSLYFEDFSLGIDQTSIAYVDRRATLAWRGEHVRAGALVQNYQTIDQSIDRLVRPYTRLPQLVSSGLWRLGGGLRLSYDAEAVNFDRDQGVTGVRFDAMPQLSWPLRGAGWFVTPAAGYRYTLYDLRRTAVGADRSPDRRLPFASLDAGLAFERRSASGRWLQTLEPRALYSYVPYRDQDDLPVFDTGVPDLSLTQLFRTNRYLGRDRVADANQIAVGVTTRLIDSATGVQRLSAMLGQIYYFKTPRVVLPGETAPTGHTSDFIGQLSLSVYRHWHVDVAQQWNPRSHDTVRHEFNLQYRPGGGRLLNFGYRYRKGSLEQFEAAAVWPFNDRWRVFGRNVYSLRDDAAIETFAGFEYTSCCWRARLMGRRYVSSRTGERDNAIVFQLELLGLSSVGKSSDAFLERTIRGYSRDFDRAGP